MTNDFDALLATMKELHDKKNKDYAGDVDPLANFTIAEEFGVPAWLGCLIRLSDKFSRVKVLARKEYTESTAPAVLTETIEDTLLDLANYALLTIILRRKHVAILDIAVADDGGVSSDGTGSVDAGGENDASGNAGSRGDNRIVYIPANEIVGNVPWWSYSLRGHNGDFSPGT